MTLFDRVFSGNDAVYGLTEGAIDAAIAQHGEDKAVSFPDTAYSLPCYYSVTGTKVTTLKELKELTVLKNKFPEYSAAKIPTLEEVLDAVKASDIQVNIELKTGIYWYPEIEQKVADLVKKAGMEERVIYSSFNHYSIQQMKKIVPEAETAYLYSDVILNVAEYAKNTKVDGLHPAVYHVKMADFLKEYLGSNLNIRVWTVNEKADMKWLIDAGVTAIITNYPDMAVQIKKEAEV